MGEEGQGHAAVALGPEIRERSGNGPEDALYLRLTLKEMISGPTFSLSNIHTRAYMHAPPPNTHPSFFTPGRFKAEYIIILFERISFSAFAM